MGLSAALAASAVAAASIGGALISSSGAQSAAQTQATAATTAAQLQQQNFQQTQNNLSPYVQAGATALPTLQGLTGTGAGGNPLTSALTAPFQPTQAQLAATPGYQFTLGQGLESTQNSYAAEGLGQSGAAEKGAANYAEGLASNTYQQQFQNYLSQNSQIYNMVAGVSGSGQNAAAGLGSLSLNNTGAVNALNTAGAAATAAGTVGSANALSNTFNTLGALAYNTPGMFASSPGINPAAINGQLATTTNALYAGAGQ